MISNRLLMVGLLTGILVSSNGCLMGVSGSKQVWGTAVRPSVLREITLGETTKEWLIEKLGPATSTQLQDDGVELLSYEYVVRDETSVQLIFVFYIQDEEVTRKVMVFEIRDGIVQNYRPGSDKKSSYN